MAAPVIADTGSQHEVLNALLNAELIDVDQSTTANIDLLAAREGHKAVAAFVRLRSSGDGNVVQFASGTSPTDVGGPHLLDAGESLEGKLADGQAFATSAVGEKLVLKVTRSAGKVAGTVAVAYVKVRGDNV